MIVTKLGGNAFAYLVATLSPGESMVTEPGAMVSMDQGVNLKTKLNGGLFRAILMKYLGKESIFINRFVNETSATKNVVISQANPGDIQEVELQGETLFIQPGSFIACTEGVTFALSFAGLTSWMIGEGLFRLKLRGPGKCWYGSYGAILEKDIAGTYIVDNGHLLSYPPSIKLKLQLSGGIISSLLGGEGFVARLEGTGKIKLQSRSIGGLASWINSKF